MAKEPPDKRIENLLLEAESQIGFHWDAQVLALLPPGMLQAASCMEQPLFKALRYDKAYKVLSRLWLSHTSGHGPVTVHGLGLWLHGRHASLPVGSPKAGRFRLAAQRVVDPAVELGLLHAEHRVNGNKLEPTSDLCRILKSTRTLKCALLAPIIASLNGDEDGDPE